MMTIGWLLILAGGVVALYEDYREARRIMREGYPG